MSSYYAAPFGITLLAEFGARVIKIEPHSGDLFRRIEGSAKSIQGKESIAVDLKTEEGRAIFHELARRADALMHNFRPGSWEGIGLDYETVRKANPRIIYLYAGSYGSRGPFARQPAFHPMVSAITGSGIRMSGEGNPPMDSMQGDPDGALGVGTAMLLGLHAQRRTGTGQYMESRMITSGAFDVSDEFYDYAGRPPEITVDPGQHGYHALYRLYDTGRGWLFLAAPQEKEWRRLCQAIGMEQLMADPRFSSAEARREHDQELAAILEQRFRARTAQDWETALVGHDVACVRADGLSWNAFFLLDASIKENGFHAVTSHQRYGGDYHRHGAAVHFSDLSMALGPPANIGEHTRPILRELGYSEERIRALEERKVVLHDGPWAVIGE